jgi:thiopurine S-methyltransferase
MQEKILDKNYWQSRWQEGQTGWDIGYASPAHMGYAQQQIPKHAKILIPGCGNAYEAEVLWNQGYKSVFVVDIAQEPLDALKRRCPDFPAQQLICSDFFEFKEKDFDFVLEQTFFCALQPSFRPQYAEQIHSLLKPNGILAGLLFDFPLTDQGPPFGGSKSEYLAYFEPFFEIIQMETSTLSIKPRLGRELWIEFKKKEA